MKKELFIIITLLPGVSFNSYAGTGNAIDGFEFFLAISGLLLMILGLLYGVDYLKRNGKTMIYKASSFLKKKATLLRKYLNKLKSDYFEWSYF